MANLQDLFQILRYEVKVLFRSWMFRVLAFLALGCIAFFQIRLHGLDVAPQWSMISLASSMPLVNAYLYNIIQALIVIFVVTDIPSREKKKGSSESLQTRPYDNFSYLWGKVLGTVAVFVLFNLFSIIICILLNLFYSFAPFHLLPYLFYLLTLTLPTLVFMTGLGLWLAGVLPSRFLAQFVLLCVLGCSVALSTSYLHGIWDLSGNSLQNLFSDVTGHINLWPYIAQRSIYFLSGIGFIFLSVYRMTRLPNLREKVCRYNLYGSAFVFVGILCGSLFSWHYYEIKENRRNYRDSFKQHWNRETCRVVDHAITLEQKGKKLTLQSDVLIYNPNEQSLSELVLFLNPGLEITAIKEGDKELNWKRDHQIVAIQRTLASKDSIRLQLFYSGKIKDEFCELNLSDAERENTSRKDAFFQFGRQGAFVGDNYLLLTPASAWYPMAFAPVDPIEPMNTGREFTSFRLKIVDPKQPLLFSQTEILHKEDVLLFAPTARIAGLTVSGGDFETKSLTTKYWNIHFLYFRGHDFFYSQYATMDSSQLTEQLDEKGERLLYYADWPEKVRQDLLVAETSLAYDSDWQVWSGKSDRVQPGIFLLPEYFTGLDYKYRSESARKRLSGTTNKWESNDVSGLIFLHFYSRDLKIGKNNPFYRAVKPLKKGQTDLAIYRNPYNVFSLYMDPDIYFYSKQYPLIDKIFQMFIREQERYKQEKGSGGYHGETRNDRAVKYLLGHSIEEACRNLESEELLQELVYQKSEDFLNKIVEHVSREDFLQFVIRYYNSHQGEIPFTSFMEEVKDSLGMDIQSFLSDWYASTHEAGFKVKDLSWAKCPVTYKGKAQFKVYNDSEEDGEIIAVVEPLYPKTFTSRERVRIPVEAKKAKEVVITGRIVRYYIDFGLALNQPSWVNIENVPEEFDGRETKEEIVCTVNNIDPKEFIPSPGIVVDNTDEGFQVIEPKRTLLQKLLDEFGIESRIAGNCWKESSDGAAYGKYARGYHAKTGGDGKTKAKWNTAIKEPGRYKVMAFVLHNQTYRKEIMQNGVGLITDCLKESAKFHYTVSYGSQKSEVEIETNVSKKIEVISSGRIIITDGDSVFDSQNEKGETPTNLEGDPIFWDWVELGVYDFPKGEAYVILDDRGDETTTIYADAVKWVRVN